MYLCSACLCVRTISKSISKSKTVLGYQLHSNPTASLHWCVFWVVHCVSPWCSVVVVQVMKLVHAVAQARHTASRMLERCAAASSGTNSSLWWRLTAGLLDAKEAESEDSEQSLKKTSELLERALENLCHIFKVGHGPSSSSSVSFLLCFCPLSPPSSLLLVLITFKFSPSTLFFCLLYPLLPSLPLQLNQAQVSQLVSGLDWSQDPGTCCQLPDCIQGENGLELTELGRQQVGWF